MRLLGRPDRIELADPLHPAASCRLADRRVAHARELRVVEGFLLLDELKTRGGIGLACFLHPGADEALEVFANRHDESPSFHSRARLPSSAVREDEVRHTDPGVFPPLPQRGPLLGKGHRGWARISAGERLQEQGAGSKKRKAERKAGRKPDSASPIPVSIYLLPATSFRIPSIDRSQSSLIRCRSI